MQVSDMVEKLSRSMTESIGKSIHSHIWHLESAYTRLFKELATVRVAVRNGLSVDFRHDIAMEKLENIESMLVTELDPSDLRRWTDCGPLNIADDPSFKDLRSYLSDLYGEIASLKAAAASAPKYKIDSPSDASVRKAVMALTNGFCAYCNDELGSEWHVEHVVPKSSGGPDALANYVPACKSCNTTKHARHVVEFIRNGKRCWPKPWEVKDVGTATAPAAPDTFSCNGDGELPEAAE